MSGVLFGQFVGGIPYAMTEPELERFFSMYGVPRDVFILKNESLQSKGKPPSE